MADSKISALPASTTPLAGTEVLPIVQSSTTKQVSVANLTTGRAISFTSATMSTGSLVPSTAGQGINFTANTAQAGMTSQLLNWYEEGTWTPAQGSGLVIVGTFSSSGYYTRVGRLVTINFTVAGSTSISVGAFGQITDNLPFTAGPLDTPATTLVGTASNVTVIGGNSKLVYAFSALSSDRFTISGTYRA